MAKLLEMPKLSPTMEEGQISAWHKKEGDEIAVDDLLAEVETDKATMEFRSFDKGTLLKILVPAGSVVKLGDPVAVVGKKGEDISSLVPGGGDKAEKQAEKPEKKEASKEGSDEAAESQKSSKPPSDKPAERKETSKEAAEEPPARKETLKEGAGEPPARKETSKPAAEEPPARKETSKPAAEEGRVKASPYVRKLAREHGIDLHGLNGSGPNGRIVARDLENAPKSGGKPAAVGELAAPEARPLSMMRKAIARRLTESKQTVPHFYLTIDVDADPIHALREQVNQDLAASAKKGEEPLKVSFNDLIVKACAIGLVRVPECNAQFTAEAILIHQRVDISVAVAVPDGLITPVVRDADLKSVLEISAEVRDLAGRAKAKKLKPEEMSNGTFSISNLGMYGIDSFAAVINPPEGAILAVGQVREEPVVKAGQVVPGRRLAMTLSCDHRVVDGAIGATFLKALRQLVEHPTQILL